MCSSIAKAADEDNDSTSAAVNEQLRDIQHQLELQKSELEQQKEYAEKLEKTVDCNWSLLQAYNFCKVQFGDDVEKQLECTKEAKQKFNQCMTGSSGEAN